MLHVRNLPPARGLCNGFRTTEWLWKRSAKPIRLAAATGHTV